MKTKAKKVAAEPEKTLRKESDAVGFAKILKFAGVGFATTIFDYLIYELVVMLIFSGNTDMAGVSSAISGIAATFMAYFLHSRITWKDRNPGRYGIIKFFLWNMFVVLALRPVLSSLFDLLDPFSEFVYLIVGWIPLFSSYDFVDTTTIYVLMMLISMTLNFIFYEKLVFGGKKDGEKKDMQSVRQSGEKQNREKKSEQRRQN